MVDSASVISAELAVLLVFVKKLDRPDAMKHFKLSKMRAEESGGLLGLNEAMEWSAVASMSRDINKYLVKQG